MIHLVVQREHIPSGVSRLNFQQPHIQPLQNVTVLKLCVGRPEIHKETFLEQRVRIRVVQKLAKILYHKTPFEFGCIFPQNIIQIFFGGGWGQKWGGAAPLKFQNGSKHYLEKIPLRFSMQQQNLNFMRETIS